MKTSVIITGIIALVLLEAWALYNGHNGTYFAIVIAVIAGAIGVVIPTPKALK